MFVVAEILQLGEQYVTKLTESQKSARASALAPKNTPLASFIVEVKNSPKNRYRNQHFHVDYSIELSKKVDAFTISEMSKIKSEVESRITKAITENRTPYDDVFTERIERRVVAT